MNSSTTNKVSFVAFANFGCIEICQNMITSLMAVCPDCKMTVFCTDDAGMNILSAANLPISIIRHKPANHKTEEYVDYQQRNWNAITEEKYRVLYRYMSESSDSAFFYADCDLFFRKSPMEYFEELLDNPSVHMVFQTDQPLGDKYCTGAILIRNSERSKEIINSCLSNMCNQNDQDCMNRILGESVCESVSIFPSDFCSNGYLYFKSNEVKDPTIIHANFFVGIETKKNILKSNGYWLLGERA